VNRSSVSSADPKTSWLNLETCFGTLGSQHVVCRAALLSRALLYHMLALHFVIATTLADHAAAPSDSHLCANGSPTSVDRPAFTSTTPSPPSPSHNINDAHDASCVYRPPPTRHHNPNSLMTLHIFLYTPTPSSLLHPKHPKFFFL
jgi:hypothetical protein